jgi:iron-sulfur cluster repair protein YtfE (RIC family)
MLTRLGRAAAPEDAVGLLLDCHDRIRTFLSLARRVAEASSADRDVPEAAARVARYFREALPLHARDEEESILPRLNGADPEVDAALLRMEREHETHGPPLAALIAACDALAAGPSRLPELAPELSAATAALDAHFVVHLRREEDVIFPAMRRLLTPADDAEIVRELRARRGA